MKLKGNVFEKSEIDSILGVIARIIASSKSSIKVKKIIDDDKNITISIQYFGVANKTPELAIEELRYFKRDSDWLITDYINQPYIDYKYQFATPGVWDLTWRYFNESKPGAIHITRNGEVKLIKFSE